MKVFISASGSRSKAVAEALREWIPDVIQAAEPWISSADIESGARWSLDLAKQLDQAQFGIICLTPENLTEPWINFESGAISKKFDDKTRVCPYLLGLDTTDLKGPLVQFQLVRAIKEDTRILMQTINHALGDGTSGALDDGRFDRTFNKNWPILEDKLKRIKDARPVSGQTRRKDPDKLDEILKNSRAQLIILQDLYAQTEFGKQKLFFDEMPAEGKELRAKGTLGNSSDFSPFKLSEQFSPSDFRSIQDDIVKSRIGEFLSKIPGDYLLLLYAWLNENNSHSLALQTSALAIAKGFAASKNYSFASASLRKLGRYAEAKAFASLALEQDKTNVDADYNLALIFKSMGDFDKAKFHAKQVLSKSDDLYYRKRIEQEFPGLHDERNLEDLSDKV